MGSAIFANSNQSAEASTTQLTGDGYNTTGIDNVTNSEAGDTTILSSNNQPAYGSNYNIDESSNEFGNNYNNSSDLNLNTTTAIQPHTNNNGTTTNLGEDDFNFNLFGSVIYPFRWMTLPTLYSWLGPISSLAMIFGCVLPYVPQYKTIQKNRNCQGFSTFVCLTLLLANILRVAFWFGHAFETPLLVQSALMILAQILLLQLCIRVKRQNAGTLFKKRSLFTSSPRYFWRWTDLISYLEFLVLFSTVLGLTMHQLIHFKPFVEAVGYCALVTESMLGFPQVIKNYKNKSVQGMSISMVLMWFGGDTFKTGYFIANNTPYQFWLCGLLQITIDIIILFQVCLFRQNAPLKVKTRDTEDLSPKEMMAL